MDTNKKIGISLILLGGIIGAAILYMMYTDTSKQSENKIAISNETASSSLDKVDTKIEMINGIAVPPEPDPQVNNSTLQGVDSNNNGVRDDVERFLAKEFGANTVDYKKVFLFAKAEQAVIVSPSPITVAAYTKEVDCSTMSAEDLNKATYALLNTQERRNTYAQANAGTTGGVCE